jgi:hypothetical protein
LVATANGCVFGGYTPIAWCSVGGSVPDRTLKSFIFTIDNPHNLGHRVFPQKRPGRAIFDHESHGPGFGDFAVWGDDNGNWSSLGGAYTNDTGIPGKEVLTGSYLFDLEEIEVFQVV